MPGGLYHLPSLSFGVRDPNSEKNAAALAAANVPAFSLATVPDAIAWAEAVILAVPGTYSHESIVELAALLGGPEGPTRNKLIIDATNPLSPFPALVRIFWDGCGRTCLLAPGTPSLPWPMGSRGQPPLIYLHEPFFRPWSVSRPSGGPKGIRARRSSRACCPTRSLRRPLTLLESSS